MLQRYIIVLFEKIIKYTMKRIENANKRAHNDDACSRRGTQLSLCVAINIATVVVVRLAR